MFAEDEARIAIYKALKTKGDATVPLSDPEYFTIACEVYEGLQAAGLKVVRS